MTAGLISIAIIDDVASANEALMEVLVTEINKTSRLVMTTLDIFNVIPLFNLIIIYLLCSKISNLSSPRINAKYPYLLNYVPSCRLIFFTLGFQKCREDPIWFMEWVRGHIRRIS